MQRPCCIVDPMCCNSSIGLVVSAHPVISSPRNLVIADLPLCCLNCKSTHFKYWSSDFLASKLDNLVGFWIKRDKQTTEWRLREHTKQNALLDCKSRSGSPVEKPCILHFELGAETLHLCNRWGEDSIFTQLLSNLIHMFSDGLVFGRVMMDDAACEPKNYWLVGSLQLWLFLHLGSCGKLSIPCTVHTPCTVLDISQE